MDKEGLFINDKGIVRRFLRMLWKGKIPYVWIIGYIIIYAFLTNIGISVTEYTAAMFSGNVDFLHIILPFLLFKITSMILSSVSLIVEKLCIARIDRNFRRMTWSKIVKLPYQYYQQNEPKELISRITTDVAAISNLIMKVFVMIITTGYAVIITLKKIGTYDSSLMVSLIAILPFGIVIAIIVGKLQFGLSDRVNKKNAELTQTIAERTNHSILIKSFSNEEKEYQNGKEKMEELYSIGMKNTWLSVLTSPMYMIVGMMQFIVIVLVGRGFYSNGSLSLQEWITYLGLALNIVNNLTAYCGFWTTLKASQGATNRVSSIVSMADEALLEGKDVSHLSGNVCFENVSFRFEEKVVLQNITANFPAGKVTAIIGKSGSGKTTMMNILARLYDIEEGKVSIGDNDISQYKRKSYREAISYVTQESVMLSGTLKDNILYGIQRKVSQDELESACKAAFLDEFISALPEGYDTRVGEEGSTLSGGQKQRIAFARALLKKSSLLLLDEATAAMDINVKEDIWGSLKSQNGERTIVTVAHDKQTIQKADYIMILDNGILIDQGTSQEIKERNTYYQELINGREED